MQTRFFDDDVVPDELILRTFQFMTQQQLCLLAQVNKRFKRIADDDSLKPTIKFYNLGNKQVLFTAPRTCTIKNLKIELANKSDQIFVHPSNMELISNKKQVMDNKTVASSGIIDHPVYIVTKPHCSRP